MKKYFKFCLFVFASLCLNFLLDGKSFARQTAEGINEKSKGYVSREDLIEGPIDTKNKLSNSLDKIDRKEQLSPIGERVVNTKVLQDNIVREEAVSCYAYEYGDKMKDSPYRYILTISEVAYKDLNNKEIAYARAESKFRYSKIFNSSRCLSTTYTQRCRDSKYSIKVETRTKNLSRTVGESFAKITFRKGNTRKDKNKYVFALSKNGRISMKKK